MAIERETIAQGGDEAAHGSTGRRMMRSLFRDSWTVAGAVIVAVFVFAGLFGPSLAPQDPLAQNLLSRLQPPSIDHFFGTDALGRDMLSRILHGARISLTIGVVAASIPLVIGTLMGAIAGYYGGVYDTLIMRFIDMLLAFPGILSAILIIAIAGPGVDSVIVAVGIFGIPETARLIRGSVLSTREREFVDSARVVGLPGPFILAKYILPNCIAPVIVLTTLNIGTAILTAAALSFLGLGVQPPQPEWGAMVSAGRSYMRVAPHLTTIPGLVVFMVVLGFNLLGDGLRDALDPRLKTESRKGAA